MNSQCLHLVTCLVGICDDNSECCIGDFTGDAWNHRTPANRTLDLNLLKQYPLVAAAGTGGCHPQRKRFDGSKSSTYAKDAVTFNDNDISNAGVDLAQGSGFTGNDTMTVGHRSLCARTNML